MLPKVLPINLPQVLIEFLNIDWDSSEFDGFDEDMVQNAAPVDSVEIETETFNVLL